ncbi:MAG: DUF4296 domain-containing protein [Flavobacterium sp.]|jgi:hypothetical protein|uniref:DUF4296 domain-containing protein n=1 Tax=Flavobacterium macrobrachii TaxID=591204 RepID=A0ABS2D3F3_9FLAO|nr:MULTISPECIES: DUF4296 domain-containing protein [Flavobacterium]MBM6500967.1 DUF4296 domain-containing protein [Flavobacterium macrobrachii]MCZ8330162.1 DUF4296 domain-containing protein [Flavobacterium sp.]
MKKIFFFCVVFLAVSCNNSVIEKPSNLIEKDKMVDILYDISLLETVKSQGIKRGFTQSEINQYILKKYKIDSLQLISSNKYYASDAEEYKRMFEKVKAKLDEDDKKVTGKTAAEKNSTENSDAPKVY